MGALAVSWAAISGRWTFKDRAVVFEGQGESAMARGVAFPIGLAVSSRSMRNGKCRVAVRFAASFGSAEKVQAGGLVIGYKGQQQYHIVVQLGAFEGAFVVSEFIPGFGWRAVAWGGDRRNLESGHTYPVEAELIGQEISVTVENVPVIQHLLSRPLDGTQVGLLAAGEERVEFNEFEVEGSKPRAFVAMEFSERYDPFYREVIQKHAEDLGFEVVRIDEVSRPGIIFKDIQSEIQRADVVIAEISPSNSNVYYELGYSHALNKPTILLAQRGAQLPFDIRSYRVVFYNDTIAGKPEVEQSLRRHLESIHSGVTSSW